MFIFGQSLIPCLNTIPTLLGDHFRVGIILGVGWRGWGGCTGHYKLRTLGNKRKIGPKELPICLISHLLTEYIRQLEILVTALKQEVFFFFCYKSFKNKVTLFGFCSSTRELCILSFLNFILIDKTSFQSSQFNFQSV